MQHMPEEVRRLRQRACPSTSQHDKTPHAWQKCPGKKRLGTKRQQNIPSFSDSTVQYIIDCNLPSHLADEDTPQNADNSCDVIGDSPPRKRPHLEVVNFCVQYVFYVERLLFFKDFMLNYYFFIVAQLVTVTVC